MFLTLRFFLIIVYIVYFIDTDFFTFLKQTVNTCSDIIYTR